jgi:PPM family protein phosphatase
VTTTPTPLTLHAFGATDVGRRRKHNEDVVLVREDLNLYVVADGAGGHNAGEVASNLATRSIGNYFGATIRATHDKPEFDAFGTPQGARRLSAAIHKANKDVLEISRTHARHRGMGTTVVATSLSPRSGLMHVANVGDSRCYRLRAGQLEQLTVDHSLISDVVEQRPDLPDDILDKLPQNIVTRALGMDKDLRVAVTSHTLLPGDRFLLCSDGLSGVLTPSAIREALDQPEPPETLAHVLIALANEGGGPDNIAALVIDCDGARDSVTGFETVEAFPAEERTDPELLILGIEELEVPELLRGASDEILRWVGKLANPNKPKE